MKEYLFLLTYFLFLPTYDFCTLLLTKLPTTDDVAQSALWVANTTYDLAKQYPKTTTVVAITALGGTSIKINDILKRKRVRRKIKKNIQLELEDFDEKLLDKLDMNNKLNADELHQTLHGTFKRCMGDNLDTLFEIFESECRKKATLKDLSKQQLHRLVIKIKDTSNENRSFLTSLIPCYYEIPKTSWCCDSSFAFLFHFFTRLLYFIGIKNGSAFKEHSYTSFSPFDSLSRDLQMHNALFLDYITMSYEENHGKQDSIVIKEEEKNEDVTRDNKYIDIKLPKSTTTTEFKVETVQSNPVAKPSVEIEDAIIKPIKKRNTIHKKRIKKYTMKESSVFRSFYQEERFKLFQKAPDSFKRNKSLRLNTYSPCTIEWFYRGDSIGYQAIDPDNGKVFYSSRTFRESFKNKKIPSKYTFQSKDKKIKVETWKSN